mgnify:CR=1 FL=1
MEIEQAEFLEPVKLGIFKGKELEERLVYSAGIYEIDEREEFHFYSRLVNGVPFKDERQTVNLSHIEYIKRVKR